MAFKFAQISPDGTLVTLCSDAFATSANPVGYGEQLDSDVDAKLAGIISNLGITPGACGTDILAAITRCGYSIVQHASDGRNGWVISV